MKDFIKDYGDAFITALGAMVTSIVFFSSFVRKYRRKKTEERLNQFTHSFKTDDREKEELRVFANCSKEHQIMSVQLEIIRLRTTLEEVIRGTERE